MAFNINELRETLELNRSEIMNNHLLTNEYMIDDIMRELGYNKRRNKNVKRLLNKPIDWEVLSPGSPRIAVKVFALGEPIDTEQLQEAMKYCKDKPFSIFIVTNGEAMTVCRYNKVKRDYAEVCDISLLEELDDIKKSVVEAISNDGFNLEIIDSIVSQRDISPEKVKEVLKNNIGLLASHVATWLGDSSNSKIEQCKVVIGNLFFSENIEDANTVDITEYTTIIEQLQKELETAKQNIPEEVDVTEYTNKIAELQNEVTTLQSKVSEYEVQMATNEENTANYSEEVIALKETIDGLHNEVNDKDEKITKLENEVELLRASSVKSVNVSDDIQGEIEEYRAKIQELASKAAESEDTIEKLQAELKEAKDSLDNMSGADKQKALDLLGVIEDSKEIPRSYVAVINTELMQYDDLPTFVGRALQKLYEIKNYEASQFIFNGDIFKLVQPAERNDLIMNNKAYDVRVDGIHEDEVLNKLRIVYSHFSSDIIFECKKIGSLELVEEKNKVVGNTEEIEVATDDMDWGTAEEAIVEIGSDSDDIELVEDTKEVFETSIENNGGFKLSLDKVPKDLEDNIEVSDGTFDDVSGIFGASEGGFDTTEEQVNDELFSNNGFGTNFEGGFEEDVNLSGEPFANMQTDDNYIGNEETYLSGILCSQLLQVDDLIWTDENVTFNNIKYIGSSSINFNINMNNEPISNEQLFCKSLDAVLALAISMGNLNVLSLLRQTDLSQINNFIKLYTEEYADYPRINGTRYVVAGIESVVQVASILADACNTLGIDTSDIFLFFDATTTSQQLLDTWGYEEDAIQLREYTDLQVQDTADAIAVLKGGIFNNIIVTKNSLQAHRAIFKETLAVRTNYLAKMINNANDFVDVIRGIMTEAFNTNQYTNINSIGNVIGEQYKLVSENPMEVSSNSVKIDINGREFYISIVENWQMPLSIIKTHTALLANTSIAVKLNINSQALNFYLTEFEVAEPSLSLAVSSFCNYVQSCIR